MQFYCIFSINKKEKIAAWSLLIKNHDNLFFYWKEILPLTIIFIK
jgi:hypothetical protein